MSIIKVDELSPRSGNDIAITSLKTITGLASQFKITGGTAGQALITDGSGGLSFGAVDSLPTQSGQAGKFLKTDGTAATWDTVDEFSVSIAEAAPGSSSAGALWWKSDEGRLKIYYNDGSSSQWVDAFPVAESPPADPAVGGDLTGVASNAQIAANKVGITELNVADGTSGQALKTDGSGTLSFGDVSVDVYDIATASTGYFDLPAGTTAQRPGTPATGMVRNNTTDDVLEWYTGSSFGWRQFAGANPTITSINPTTSIAAGTSITVTGINFQSGSVVKLIGTDSTVYTAASTSFVDSTQVTFTTPDLPVANEPYDVKLILPAGGFFILANALDAGGVPVWTTAAGSLGEIGHAATGTHFTLVATDPDGQAITYSADTANTTILTTAGLTLNSDGTITGDPTDQASGGSTVYSFDVIATDSTGVNSTTRSFSITVRYEFFEGASGGTITTYSSGGINYRVHTFTTAGTTQTFNAGIGGTCDILAVAGGGGGGRVHSDQDTSQGGGGAGCVGVATNLVIAAGNQLIDIGRGAYHDQTDRYWKTYGPNNDTNRHGLPGEDTVLTGIITLPGGGAGGRSDGSGGTPPAGNNGGAGGSGGGSGSRSSTCDGGASNKPTVSGWTTYGNAGGGAHNAHTENGGGGGGGAGGVGADGAAGNTNNNLGLGGDGGIGIQNDFQTGVNQYYGGGGAGGTCHNTGYQASGGLGGGGKGNCKVNANPDPAWSSDMAGTQNTGGGGGGSSDPVGGNDGHWAGGGGSGIVIIRYVV